MEKFNFSYDSENDDLFIYLDGKISEGGIELGNFVLDFDKKGDLVALQILNASEVLSKILSKMIKMSEIKEIRVDIMNFRNMEGIKFEIRTDKERENANILIPHIREKSPVLRY
ncbi:MAG: DUF2283 domain-containing protein [Candidatus Pacearchaeota archaeon]|nr:DUF2283 domain-containing protein [Candidatus Pacearchaeota archaeon]